MQCRPTSRGKEQHLSCRNHQDNVKPNYLSGPALKSLHQTPKQVTINSTSNKLTKQGHWIWLQIPISFGQLTTMTHNFKDLQNSEKDPSFLQTDVAVSSHVDFVATKMTSNTPPYCCFMLLVIMGFRIKIWSIALHYRLCS